MKDPISFNRMTRNRWTAKQQERAAKISNDIAENIDCGESRKVLREAISIWADRAMHAHACKNMVHDSAILKHLKKLVKRKERT